MTSEQVPLVSVVTPAYNEERYLCECIESVLAQTYTHWDYTIVNNCSTDRTLDIALEYAARDRRIRIHNNETFVPVIANHNIAFRQLSPESKYCKLVGADDWIYPECLEKMVGLAEEHPTVAIVGAYRLSGMRLDPTGLPFLSGTRLDPIGLPFPNTVMSGREVCRTYLSGETYPFMLPIGAPTPLLFRADIIRSRYPFFNGPHLHADAEACFEVLEHHDFGFVHQVLTFTRVRENSLSSFSKEYGMWHPEQLDFLVKFGPKYLSERELTDRIRENLAHHYDYLGSQVYRRRGQEFWSIHRNRLADLGYAFSMARVLVHATFHALGAADRAARRAIKGVCIRPRTQRTSANNHRVSLR